ncbi:hypothetical protein LJC07_07005 [Christensenellaceae bacterium OttesenSCG-928-L17]|nr:hypothetical protein [Christensenellaceae bacterium OttesenSCG-928-L17]
MKKPILVIMAAGMGSRYGGLKQIEPVGAHGELLTDYSLYDAKAAGFEEVIFIINRKIEADFRDVIGERIQKHMHVRYAYQELDSMLPPGVSTPVQRVRPWGTGHAVLCCKDMIDTPFAVINADDYYGASAFSLMFQTLREAQNTMPQQWCMVGYPLFNTLTEHGFVSRGVCDVTPTHMLRKIVERVHIEKKVEGAVYSEDGGATRLPLPIDATVSMNLWGFTTPGIFDELQAGWLRFWETDFLEKPERAEFFLPNVIDTAIQAGRASVRVLRSNDQWYGVTYREDKPRVVAAIAKLTAEGQYPERL